MPWDGWRENKEKIYRRAETCKHHIRTHRESNTIYCGLSVIHGYVQIHTCRGCTAYKEKE